MLKDRLSSVDETKWRDEPEDDCAEKRVKDRRARRLVMEATEEGALRFK